MSATARRLLWVFSLLLLALAAATFSAWRGTEQMGASLRGIIEREARVRLALSLATSVRDQYAHIAHSLLLGNLTHQHHYDEARGRVLRLLAEVEASPAAEVAAQRSAAVRAASEQVDGLFRREVAPALARGEISAASKVHEEILALVDGIQRNVDQLVRLYESDIRAMEVAAGEAQRAVFGWNLGLLAVAIGLAVGGAFWLSAAIAAQQAQLVASEKLASVGRLAAGVAHEINNPVGVILGYARLLEAKVATAERGAAHAVADEARRIQEIVQGLLDLSRPARLARSPVDLRELVDEVVARLHEDDRVPRAQVSVDGAATVGADAGKMRQVLDNLVRNACQAAGPSGTVRISLGAQSDGVLLVLRDSGPGFAEEIAARLFEPFVSGRDNGTGLGLAIARALVIAHGGSLTARNHPDGGAELALLLPAGAAREGA